MSRLLIIASKHYNDPTGGGGTVVKQLVDTFTQTHFVDLILFRTPIKNEYVHPKLTTIYHPIRFRNENKFRRRIDNISHNLTYLHDKVKFDLYDKIIIVHVSKMFGFESLGEEILRKTVLFPMYLTPSYLKSNEVVPKEYTEEERKSLECVNKIITPSFEEKQDLVSFYGIHPDKIVIISRGIDEVFFSSDSRKIHSPLRLINVSSFRHQKNIIDSVKLIRHLVNRQIDARLTIIGHVDEPKLFSEVKEYIILHHLEEHVQIIHDIPLELVAQHFLNSDIQISTSLWETFGRVIYEGFASGLPAIVLSNVQCFQALDSGDYILRYRDFEQIESYLRLLTTNPKKYQEANNLARKIALRFRSKLEQDSLRGAIL